MATQALASVAILLSLNLLFFTMVISHNVPCPPAPKSPEPHPKSPPSAKPTCPKDTLKLGVCANLLNNLVHVVERTPAKTPCCSLIQDLADLQAAVCLCTAIKANILGNDLNVPVSLSLLLNSCGKRVPKADTNALNMMLNLSSNWFSSCHGFSFMIYNVCRVYLFSRQSSHQQWPST